MGNEQSGGAGGNRANGPSWAAPQGGQDGNSNKVRAKKDVAATKRLAEDAQGADERYTQWRAKLDAAVAQTTTPTSAASTTSPASRRTGKPSAAAEPVTPEKRIEEAQRRASPAAAGDGLGVSSAAAGGSQSSRLHSASLAAERAQTPPSGSSGNNVSPATAGTGGEDWLIHELSPRDTLPGLALRYGVTVESIKRANRLWGSDFGFLTKVTVPIRAKDFLNSRNLLRTDNDGAEVMMLPRTKAREDRGEWFVVRERDERTYVVHADINRTDLIERFVRMSHCDSEDVARSFLERKDWNFAQALGAYFAHAGQGTPPGQRLSARRAGNDDATTSTGGTEEEGGSDWGAAVEDDEAAIRAQLLAFGESDDGGGESDGRGQDDTGGARPLKLTPSEMARMSRFVVVGQDEEHDEEHYMRRGPELSEVTERSPAREHRREHRRQDSTGLQNEADDIFSL